MTSIQDVASLAGVSPATVSRVLNNQGNVSPDRVERVLAAVAELGYRRNALARALRRQVTDVWSVIVPSLENPYFTSVVRGIASVADSHDFSVVLGTSNGDFEAEDRLLEMARYDLVAGVVISPTSSATSVERLLDKGISVVLIDQQLEGVDVDAVTVDNRKGAADAAALMLEWQVERPACIAGPNEDPAAFARLSGFRNALLEGGSKLAPELKRHADSTFHGARSATLSLLDEREPPDGLFVTNSVMTMGALDVLDRAKVRIPDDLVLVGCDEVPWARVLRPQLGFVLQPGMELGEHAARLLIDRIQGHAGPARHVVLRPEIHKPLD